MPKPRRGKKGGNKKSPGDVPEYVSDEEALYGIGDEPDPESREYMYDDIDEFHAARDKILVDKGHKFQDSFQQSDEEEVLALDSEESDDDEIRNLKAQLRKVKAQQRKEDYGSDLEDKDEEEEEDDEEVGLPDSKKWGKKRGKYYGDDDIGLKNIDDEEAEAVLEEKEAIRLQKKMAAEMDDQDFGLDLFKPPANEKEEMEEKEEKIVKDLSKLSKREKLQLLKKESPELLTLIDDFKEKLHEVQDTFQPIREVLLKQNVSGKAADYVNTKFHLNLNYCTNILFYLTLKAKQIPVHNHPVIKRLLQYRNLLTQLQPLDSQMAPDLADIVSRIKAGEDVILGNVQETGHKFVRRKREQTKKSADKNKKKSLTEPTSDSDDDMYEDFATLKEQKKKLKEEGRYETKDEQAALDYYQMMKGGRIPDVEEEKKEETERMEDEEADPEGMGYEEQEDGKRGITYQIEKNKGLIASKRKELRNPRVKHRMKYKKAKVRRKGQIREPRKELQRYGGEISGIRSGIKRSVKLK